MHDSFKALGVSVVVSVMSVLVVQNFYKLNKLQLTVTVVVLAGIAFLLIYRPPSLPKPVLGWRGQRSHHLITSDFNTVTTQEYPSTAPTGTVIFYIENQGPTDLNNGTLYIMFDLDSQVTSDRPFHLLPRQELVNPSLTIDIPLIRKSSSEPFVFSLTISKFVHMSQLQIKIEADQIPSTAFPLVTIKHRP
jgi:hypothetical protein